MQRGEFLLLMAAIGLIVGGVALASLGGELVRGLVIDAAMRPFAPLCPPEEYCYAQFSFPDPRPTFAAYLAAIPMGVGTGYALHRSGVRRREAFPDSGRVLRIAGVAASTPMAWMAMVYVWGGLAEMSISLRYPDVLGLAYAASLLVVPAVLVAVGCVLVMQWVSERLSARTRSARG